MTGSRLMYLEQAVGSLSQDALGRSPCCCGPTPVPFLHRTRPAGLHDHPLRKSSPNGWWEHRRPLPAPALAPQPCSVMDTSTQTHHDSASWET